MAYRNFGIEQLPLECDILTIEIFSVSLKFSRKEMYSGRLNIFRDDFKMKRIRNCCVLAGQSNFI